MILQPTTSKPPFHHYNQTHVSLSSTLSYSLSFPSGSSNSTSIRFTPARNHSIATTCSSISRVHSYGTVDYEKRPMLKWNGIYKRISMMQNPEMGAGSVLNQCENEGKKISKWELCRVVKELRKFRRYKLALEVYEWMNNRGERFRMTTSDTAIQLDLIAKVHGVLRAEEYFDKLPDSEKDNRIYGSLLNTFVRAGMKEKAEHLINEMRNRGYTTHALPFNVMMTLYMNLKHYDKVESIVSEMMEKNVPLDIYSYNIWLSTCGSLGSIDKMEQVFEQMNLNPSINPNWTTFSTMATMYIKLEQLVKAEDCLRKIEGTITGRDRIPYHYLISLYGSIGKKDEVHRMWSVYKSVFPNIPNLGYHAVISSLVRLGDIKGAENIYEEWLSVKPKYDPRIGNLLLGWYVRKGLSEKADAFFDQMVEVGVKPNSMTWEILAEGHIRDRRVFEALSCLKDAASAEGSKNWRPRPANVSSILKICEQDNDTKSKDVLLGVLKQIGCLYDENYMSYIPISNETLNNNEFDEEPSNDGDGDYNPGSKDNDGAEMIYGQLQGSL